MKLALIVLNLGAMALNFPFALDGYWLNILAVGMSGFGVGLIVGGMR